MMPVLCNPQPYTYETTKTFIHRLVHALCTNTVCHILSQNPTCNVYYHHECEIYAAHTYLYNIPLFPVVRIIFWVVRALQNPVLLKHQVDVGTQVHGPDQEGPRWNPNVRGTVSTDLNLVSDQSGIK